MEQTSVVNDDLLVKKIEDLKENDITSISRMAYYELGLNKMK